MACPASHPTQHPHSRAMAKGAGPAPMSLSVSERVVGSAFSEPPFNSVPVSASCFLLAVSFPPKFVGLPGPEPELMLFPSQQWCSPKPRPGVTWVLLGSLCLLTCPLLVASRALPPYSGVHVLLCSLELCCRGRPAQKHLKPQFPEASVGPVLALSEIFICPPVPVR